MDPGLRHGYFGPRDFDANPAISPLIRDAYLGLSDLATDQHKPGAPEFWRAWRDLQGAVAVLVAGGASPDEHTRDGIRREGC